jgi:hypothetical protein
MKSRLFALITVILMGVSQSIAAQGVRVVQGDDSLRSLDTVRRLLGRGYNSFTGRLGGECVSGELVVPKLTTFAPSWEIKVLQSFEQFAQETSLEAAVSASYGAFSAQVKSKFTEASKSTRTTQFMLVRETMLGAPEINLQNPVLRDGFSTADQFYKRCGDGYVSQIQMGGALIAFLSFNQNESIYSSSVDINANGSYGSFSTSADFNGKLDSLKKDSTLQLIAHQIGGSATRLPTNMNELMEYAATFPNQFHDISTAVTVDVINEPYLGFESEEADFDDFSELTRVYAGIRAASYEALAQHRRLKDIDNFLTHYAIPATRAPGDVRDRLNREIETTRLDHAFMTEALDRCGHKFWSAESCRFSPRYLHYRTGPLPVIIKQVATRSSTPIDIDAPREMTLELRGDYCWRGNDDPCDHDGIWSGDECYVAVKSPNGAWKYQTPVGVARGHTSVWAHDTEYDDNGGVLYAIVY